ncbi:CaiB/BaiF CoA transferase family protein [Caulobacter zeae]|uniref:CaiB/BaiF CoA transferase family protein n=1 Tax=Caulobacter zeae TaxID=2055137 RepID=UPI001F0CB242|nr:CoA transferase [Caulobacter zeae]
MRVRRPLAGIKVLAVEQYGAGPYATQLMAELGAEVVKIEAPAMGGDVSRATGPFFLGQADSQFFQTFSRSKKSIALDIKTPEGRAAFEDLVAQADMVVDNLRGDQPGKLRLTYDDLKGVNPAIVCGHLSAYGRGNSRAGWPGYDYLMQAEAGLMSLTGEPDAPPARLGVSMVDFMTGTMLAFGVVSALLSARTTGEGCDVDVSLFDVALHQLSYPAVWAMNEGYKVQRLPRGAHPSIAPSQAVKTADGWGLVMCQTPKFWEALCDLAGAAELKADPRFADIPSRHANRPALSEAMDVLFGTRTTAEWTALLGGKVPFAPILEMMDALDNPFVAEVGMRDVVDHPDRAEGLAMLACPVKIDGERMPGARAPKLGEHTDEVLNSIGGAAS